MSSFIEIEKAIIATCIYEVGAFYDIVDAGLEPKHFYHPFYGEMFAEIIKMNAEDMPIDESFLYKRLNVSGRKDVEYHFSEVLCATPLGNYAVYAKELQKAYCEREIKKIAKKAGDDNELDVNMLINELTSLSEGKENRLKPLSITQVQSKPVELICSAFLPLPKDSITILSSRGGGGKTFTAIRLGLEYCIEHPNEACCLYLVEDSIGALKIRAEKVAKEIMHLAHIPDNLHIHREAGFPLLERGEMGVNFQILKRELAGYAFIIFDPLTAFYNGDENDNARANAFMRPMASWAKKDRKTILFLHHSDKMAGNTRGAGAFTDATRATYALNHFYKDKEKKIIDESRKHEKEFTLTKDNTGIVNILGAFTVTRQVLPSQGGCKETVFKVDGKW